MKEYKNKLNPTIDPKESLAVFHQELADEGLRLEYWIENDFKKIYTALEQPNWAPWLEAGLETITGRAHSFPEGQLVLKEGETMLASLSLNRIDWDGDIKALPSWDDVAGVTKTDYSETYKPEGNSLVLMSMNVAADSKGKRLPSKLIDYTKLLAQQLGVDYVIGSFRPSGYGRAKKEYGSTLLFWEYCCSMQEGSGKPLDPWLRSLSWHDMRMLAEDSGAMKVITTIEEFNMYREMYRPELWYEVEPGIWECEEVGTWRVNSDSANYAESNVWGLIPMH